jgi:hypothetical protein
MLPAVQGVTPIRPLSFVRNEIGGTTNRGKALPYLAVRVSLRSPRPSANLVSVAGEGMPPPLSQAPL